MSEQEDEILTSDVEQDQEYDPDYDDGLPEDAPGIDLTQYQNPFTKEDLQNVHLLRNSYYKNKLINIIDNSDLYESAKRAWTDIVNNYFDQNWMLANLERRHSSWTNKNSASDTDEVNNNCWNGDRIIGGSTFLHKRKWIVQRSFYDCLKQNPKR